MINNVQKPLPPGSFGLPLIGETIPLAWDNHTFYRQRLQKYGPVFKTNVFGKPTIAFVGPEAFTFFLNPDYFTRAGSNPQPVQELLDFESLPLLDGAEHLRRKRLILKAFTKDAFESYLPLIEKTAEFYVARWERLGSFAWVSEYRKLSATLSSALFTGTAPDAEAEALGATIETFIGGFTSIPVNLRVNGYGRALQSRDRLLQKIDQAIRQHRQQPHPDVLSQVMAARDAEGSQLTDSQLRREVLHLFFAAYGGIYISLTFLALTLAQHPKMMASARAEVQQKVPDGPLTLERLQGLEYLQKIAYELRRFYPINAATFFAQVKQDCEFQNFHIPKGWNAVGGIHTTMHLAHVFPEPEQFKPCRFAPEQFAARPDNSYVPHGGGPRESHRCPGEDLITVLIKTMAVHLLRRYTWELPPQNLTLNRNLFPIPQDGLKVQFRVQSH